MIQEFTQVSLDQGMVITIGVFDGVHLGHRFLLQTAVKEASARGLKSCVVTFKNHPRTVLTPGFQPRYLTSLKDRLSLIEALGVDSIVPINFTREVSQHRASEFVSLLKDHLRMQVLVTGPDFALGRNREGNVDMLRELGREFDYDLICVEPHRTGPKPVSSTAIREALASGDTACANRLLGRPFRLAGKVVVGEKRGHLLGYPTANLDIDPEMAIPADGVYATRAYIRDKGYDSITYLGFKPTFSGMTHAREVFIFDFNDDIYGEWLAIEFIAQLRGDMTFSGAEELIIQMDRDAARAREILAGA